MQVKTSDVSAASLRYHQRDHTRACANIQHTLCVADICPCAQQHCIGAYRVRRAMLRYLKFFETEG